MTRSRSSRRVLAVTSMAVGVLLAGCGSDDTGPGAGGTELPRPDDTPDDTSVPDGTVVPGGTVDRMVIGSGNVGGPVVDPQPHPIDSIAIAESYPEQLMVTFSAGDPSCTAADARAIARDDTVVVELEVGLTEDAMSRSCLAGSDFQQTVNVLLTEGLDGRSVVAE